MRTHDSLPAARWGLLFTLLGLGCRSPQVPLDVYPAPGDDAEPGSGARIAAEPIGPEPMVRFGRLDVRAGWLMTSVAIGPAGQRLATTTEAGHVVLWDLQTGRVLRTLHSLSSGGAAVAWSPDGQEVVSLNIIGRVMHWDLEATSDWEGLETSVVVDLVGPADSTPVALHVLAGNRAIVAWRSYDGEPLELGLYALETGRRLARLRTRRWASGGWWVADEHLVVDAPRGLDVYALDSLRRRRRLAGSRSLDDVRGGTVLEDGRSFRAVVGSQVVTWDLGTREQIGAYALGPDVAERCESSMTLDLSGRMAVCEQGEDMALVFLEEGRTLRTLTRRWYGGPRMLAWTPDSSTLVEGGYSWAVGRWDPTTGIDRTREQGHVQPIRALVEYDEFDEVWTLGAYGELRRWEARTGRELDRRPIAGSTLVDASFDPRERRVALCTPSAVELWSLEPIQQIGRHEGHCERLRWPAGSVIWWTSPEGLHRLDLDAGTPERLDAREGQENVAVSDDGRRVLTDVGLFDDGGRWIEGFDEYAAATAVSQDRYVVLGGTKNYVHTRDGTQAIEIPNGESVVPQPRVADFSPSGETLAVGLDDGRVLVWSMPDIELVAEASLHRGPVSALVLLDDRVLLSGGEDTTATRWSFVEPSGEPEAASPSPAEEPVEDGPALDTLDQDG